MENREISRLLSDTAKLMELHQANEFKVRSFQNASFVISKLDMPLNTLTLENLTEVKGIGKSLSTKIYDLIHTGILTDYEEYLKETPAGVVEMMRIKGIGPKKVALLWKELGIETPGELLYACNENRLIELKGFGSKTQDQIKSAIEYSISNKGFFHYASLESLALEINNGLQTIPSITNSSLTGEIRRKCEVISEVRFLIALTDKSATVSAIKSLPLLHDYTFTENEDGVSCSNEAGIKIKFYFTDKSRFATDLLFSTGSESHIEKLNLLPEFEKIKEGHHEFEHDIYKSLNLQYIEPELREGFDEIDLAKNHSIPELISFEDLKGSLHNHSTYSDGIHSLKEMAIECKKLGYEYLGICDHSKSAFYANGLSVEKVIQQQQEIDQLNSELAPFVIFKGIESDILNDGSLDYEESVLKKFDFVVASVHSGLKMSEEKATERLLKAISNPFTTILGHPTGRLLLARKGYPIDHKKVIDACAENNVVIELNAHPYRLDLDWRWIRYAVQKNVRISINPDAHHKEGYHDMYFGVCAARKGMLTKAMTFNTMGIEKVLEWFNDRKQFKAITSTSI